MNIPDSSRPRIVIVGGGFGGLNLAKALRKKEVQVVLIDQHNFHTFQPLLYQVATAGLEPDSIAYPIRRIFSKQTHFYFRMAKASGLEPAANLLHTNIGSVHYDYLVVCTGSDTNFFGMTGVEVNSMPMKSLTEALNLRSLILQNFEKALLTSDLEERESLMNFVIVGGGPTGVELAGALAELKNHILPKDYPDLDIRRMNIHLIEASDRLLAGMSAVSSAKSAEFLRALGVNLWLKMGVTDYNGQIVQTNAERQFSTQNLIWAAGVKGQPIDGLQPDVIVRGNRILVNDFNQIQGLKNVYAVGDVAAMRSEEYPNGHPMVAQVAMQQGVHLAKNFLRDLAKVDMKPFRYKDLGSMATIGRNQAVVDLPGFKQQGFFAWFIWMFIHLIQLVGFRNKLIVLINWSWSYLNFDRGIRLIVRPFAKKEQ